VTSPYCRPDAIGPFENNRPTSNITNCPAFNCSRPCLLRRQNRLTNRNRAGGQTNIWWESRSCRSRASLSGRGNYSVAAAA
jgi:hypothetical protein